jgi:hypothetical protein
MAQLYLCLSPFASLSLTLNSQLSTLPLLAIRLYRDLIVTSSESQRNYAVSSL